MCLQTLLSKYNQQYHKLFKDIPLEEAVLKGEPSPSVAAQAPAVLEAQVPLSPALSLQAQIRYGSRLPFECGFSPFFLQKCEKTELI